MIPLSDIRGKLVLSSLQTNPSGMNTNEGHVHQEYMIMYSYVYSAHVQHIMTAQNTRKKILKNKEGNLKKQALKHSESISSARQQGETTETLYRGYKVNKHLDTIVHNTHQSHYHYNDYTSN